MTRSRIVEDIPSTRWNILSLHRMVGLLLRARIEVGIVMNETQQLIKSLIEQKGKELGIDVVVEYVSDVNKRISEIENQYQEKFNSVYETNKIAGTFIPSIGKNPHYILVQKNENSMRDIMTAFHEYRHLTEHIVFLQTVFNNDIKKMKHSPLYITFNVYSEYSATLNGVLQYLKIVSREGMSQKALSEEILQDAESTYRNLEGIVNRYQLLVHSLQYFGAVRACGIFLEDINFEKIIGQMELSNELKPVLAHIIMFENNYEWYETLDKRMRTFVYRVDAQ